MRTALTISAVSHTVLLLWGVVTFVAKPHTAQSVESVAVDVISAKEFSQLTAGSKNAAAVTTPKPFVETVGERRPVDDPTGKIGRKEIADTTERPPPAPTPRWWGRRAAPPGARPPLLPVEGAPRAPPEGPVPGGDPKARPGGAMIGKRQEARGIAALRQPRHQVLGPSRA